MIAIIFQREVISQFSSIIFGKAQPSLASITHRPWAELRHRHRLSHLDIGKEKKEREHNQTLLRELDVTESE